MFVYSGRLSWYSYGIDETFVIILPNGPVRVGDAAYFFSQWTVDSGGVKKPNWFQNLVIDKVTKNQNGDDTFTFKHHYYAFEITSQEVYGKIKVVMSNPTSGSRTMALDRIWQSAGAESTGTGRIWTGKVNWLQFASNEMAIFIVPEGFGEGKPVLSLWQWTKDSAGKAKAPSFREAVQKIEPGAASGTVKFSYHSYYDITCTWDEKTEKLDVQMSEYGPKQSLGEMTLSALIERHSHDFNPPEPTPNRSEVEVRLPQAQPALARILTPMPFPRGLVETLAHTAAFVDQAGYLAKYAQERFTTLDADFHARGLQLEAAKTENMGLNDRVKKLTDDLNVEKAKSDDLQKQLAKAREDGAKEKEALQKKITHLEDTLRKDNEHDQEDHKILEATRKELANERVRVANLQKQLDNALLQITSLDAKLKAALATIADLQAKLFELQSKYDVEKKHNDELRADKACLEKEKLDLENKLKDTQEDLDYANGKIDRQKQDLDEKDQEIRDLRDERDEVVKRRKAAEAELDKVKKYRDELEDKLAKATRNRA